MPQKVEALNLPLPKDSRDSRLYQQMNNWAESVTSSINGGFTTAPGLNGSGNPGEGMTTLTFAGANQTIKPSSGMHYVSSSAPTDSLSTIVAPQGFTGQLVLHPKTAFVVNNSGNIKIPGGSFSAVPDSLITLNFEGKTWSCSLGGGASALTLAADGNANGHKIINLAADTVAGDALSNGQSPLNHLAAATGPYPMAGNKLTGLGAGTNSGDSFARSLNTINETAAPTADFSMNTHKLTGLTVNTATGDALSQAQSHLNDMAAATGDYAMGAHKLTGVAAPTVTGDALSEGRAIGATTPAAITGTTIAASTAFQVTPVHFAALPGAPTVGAIAAVDNCSTQAWGANADGAGAFKVLVWYNGTAWTVLGK